MHIGHDMEEENLAAMIFIVFGGLEHYHRVTQPQNINANATNLRRASEQFAD